MLYTAIVTKKTRLFQKPFRTEGKTIYITDTARAKKRFLKSGITNVVFNCDLSRDGVFANKLKPLYAYDEEFLMNYVGDMLTDLVSLMKIHLPVLTMAVSSEKAVPFALPFTKTVIIVGEGEDTVIDGVNVVYVKKLRRMPDAAIILNSGYLPPMVGVPRVDISEGAIGARDCAVWENISFKCSLFPYEIGAKSLMYLLNTDEKFTYEMTSVRKKLTTLFTFL